MSRSFSSTWQNFKYSLCSLVGDITQTTNFLRTWLRRRKCTIQYNAIQLLLTLTCCKKKNSSMVFYLQSELLVILQLTWILWSQNWKSKPLFFDCISCNNFEPSYPILNTPKLLRLHYLTLIIETWHYWVVVEVS